MNLLISQNEKLKKTYNQTVISCVAIIGGIIAMALVFLVVIQRKEHVYVEGAGMFKAIAVITGFSSLIASLFVKSKIISKIKSKGDQNLEMLISYLRTSSLVPFAFCEGAVIFGFLVSFVCSDFAVLLFSCVFGIIAFAIHFPRFELWVNWIQSRT